MLFDSSLCCHRNKNHSTDCCRIIRVWARFWKSTQLLRLLSAFLCLDNQTNDFQILFISILVRNTDTGDKKLEQRKKLKHFILKVEPVSSIFIFADICYYKKVCPFNGSTPMIQSNTSDFHFSWNQMPNAIGRFPWQQYLNPTLPMLLAWPELSVAMETPW